MKRISTGVAVVALTVVSAIAHAQSGWILAGSDPGSYRMTVDKTVRHTGKSSGRLESTQASSGFGTMMQSFDAAEYRGKRLQLSASVKSQDVRDWAGLWMRVDGDSPQKPLAFDNMQNRPIKGTGDWKAYRVVLDVPQGAKGIAFGILISGSGKVWLDDVGFAVVDVSVPTTGMQGANLPKNLNFEH